MAINISDEEIREIVKEEVDKSVRKRIKEMQGDYTSKGYLENLITEVLWDKIICEIPVYRKKAGISLSIGTLLIFP